MDSQLTLVAPSLIQPSAEGYFTLRFSNDNVNNTTISLPGESTRCYIVESNSSNTSTKIYYVDDWSARHLVAHLERKDILPDRITLKDGPSMRLNKWLRFKGSLIFPVRMQLGGRCFVWKKGLYNVLAMYADGDLEKPVAWFQKSRRRVVGDQEEVSPAYIGMTGEVREHRDDIVVACITLEHRIRMSEKYARIQGFQNIRG